MTVFHAETFTVGNSTVNNVDKIEQIGVIQVGIRPKYGEFEESITGYRFETKRFAEVV